jgi:uncharacterized protein YrrD
MILRYTQIIGLPIFELKDQSLLGYAYECILDNTKNSILGIVLKPGIFSKPKLILLSMDIQKVLKKHIFVRDDGALSEIADLVRVQTLIDNGIFGIGQKVQTESGQNLGRLYDYLVESERLAITKLYIKDLSKERIISAENIISIEPKLITIKDSLNIVEVANEVLSETIA